MSLREDKGSWRKVVGSKEYQILILALFVRLLSLECLLNLCDLLTPASIESFYSPMMTNLCASTWQMLRSVYSKAQSELGKLQGKGVVEVDVDKIVRKNQSTRIVRALECMEAWIMLNPSLFLQDSNVCFKFFEILEASVMGKLDFGNKGEEEGWEDGGNTMPRMLMMLKMELSDSGRGEGRVVIPVFTEISNAAEDVLTHLLNLVSFGGVERGGNTISVMKYDVEEAEGDDGESGIVWISILDQVLVSICPRKAESLVVVRDASGGYAWRSEREVVGVGEAGERIVKQVVKRRCNNLQYNKQLYDQAGEQGGDLSIHKGPAWYSKGSGSRWVT